MCTQPDLNPIYHIWDEPVRRMWARLSHPSSVPPDLTNVLLTEWAQIPTDTLRNPVDKLSRREATFGGFQPCRTEVDTKDEPVWILFHVGVRDCSREKASGANIPSWHWATVRARFYRLCWECWYFHLWGFSPTVSGAQCQGSCLIHHQKPLLF